jgi:hypothetical protein
MGKNNNQKNNDRGFFNCLEILVDRSFEYHEKQD